MDEKTPDETQNQSAGQSTEQAPPRATLYSKSHCGYCVRAKSLLERNGVDYELIDLTGDADAQVELARRTGKMTMPQIYAGDELIGGYDELVVALREPRIREALGIA